MKKAWVNRNGFTIIELLVIIVVLGIIVAISAVAYTGVQQRSRMAKLETDITAVQKLVESYKSRNGTYPITHASLNVDWNTQTARTDSNCPVGSRNADWIPDLNAALPQSNPTVTGIGGYPGCYVYVSNGTVYVLSAWNMLQEPQTTTMYRRVGIREMGPSYSGKLFYTCNHPAIGGVSGSYNINNDYYKRSMTVSNISSTSSPTCNEIPPAGA